MARLVDVCAGIECLDFVCVLCDMAVIEGARVVRGKLVHMYTIIYSTDYYTCIHQHFGRQPNTKNATCAGGAMERTLLKCNAQ